MLDHMSRLLTCVSIASNSLVAGGVFVFPVLSPSIAHILKLSQPQLTTIAMVGFVGQYPFSPLVGKILDIHGPSRCSLIAAGLFSAAFMSGSSLLAMAPHDPTWSFRCLTVAFFLAGLGTVFSLFCSLFAASKGFPRHPGAAAGFSMALFGLSPLFLTVISSRWFTEGDSGHIRVIPFLRALALMTAVSHIFGFFVLDSKRPTTSSAPELTLIDETTRLLSSPSSDPDLLQIHPDPVRDRYFWLLVFFALCSIGASEMVMSNMGAIVLSLYPRTGSISPDIVTATQVKIVSISNTLSRLVVGPLADVVTPVATYLYPDANGYPKKRTISRMVFLLIPTFLLGLGFLWMELGDNPHNAIWFLSLVTGINYGASFTMLPGIVSSGWGSTHSGRNFGMLTYAPCIGTPLFSYLYAFVSAANSQETGQCEGEICWRTTFWITTASSAAAVLSTVILWKHWRGQI